MKLNGNRKSLLLLLVNADYRQSASAKVRVPGNLRELDRSNGHWHKLSSDDSGVYEISLKPGDGRLFGFGKDPVE